MARTEPATARVVLCGHPGCPKAVARIEDGKLVVYARHGKEWHRTALLELSTAT